MSIEIVGKFLPRPRVITGLYSLDHAFVNDEGELGFPIGHGNEFFGANFIGKSTFALGIAGIIAKKQNENISFVDLEGFDRNHLMRILGAVEYDGKVFIPAGTTKVAVEDDEDLDNLDAADIEDMPKKRKAKEEKEYDEIMLDEMIRNLRKDACSVGILDSIGAISPISETEGDIGEANMGRRGNVMAQFSRKALKLCRSSKTPKTIIMLNHWYPKLGGMGYVTPGGEVKRYLTSVQILLKQTEVFPDQSYVLQGTVKKNRWGYKKVFYVFVLAGHGIHLGLSAMYDSLIYGTAKRVKATGIGVKIEDEKFTIRQLVKEAKAGNNEHFDIFKVALEALGTEKIQIEDGEESDLIEEANDE